MRCSVLLIGLCLVIVAGKNVAQEPSANPLDGKVFMSLEKLPGGDRADGTVSQVNWVVKFKDKKFTWRHYDKTTTGTYEFDGKTGAVKTGDTKIDASFDARTGILTWGKHKYRAAKTAK